MKVWQNRFCHVHSLVSSKTKKQMSLDEFGQIKSESDEKV